MKVLLLIIAVFFYVQPATAGGCDMAGDPVPGDSPGQHMEHGMDSTHDCCDEDSADPQEGCDHEMQCSTCTASATALAVNPFLATPMVSSSDWADADQVPVPHRSSLLYKPPIS